MANKLDIVVVDRGRKCSIRSDKSGNLPNKDKINTKLCTITGAAVRVGVCSSKGYSPWSIACFNLGELCHLLNNSQVWTVCSKRFGVHSAHDT